MAIASESRRDPLIYLDTSAVLRAVLEMGTSPAVEERTLELLTADERLQEAAFSVC